MMSPMSHTHTQDETQPNEPLVRMVGGIAHDFNNLLAMMRVNVDFLLEEDHSERVRSKLLAIHLATEQAARLVRQLQSIGRGEILSLRVLDIPRVLNEMKQLFVQVLPKDVNFRMVIEENTPSVVADQTQFERLLMNLVVNARDAMSGGGIIEVRAARNGDQLELAVRDTGCGMDESVKARMFDPYFTTKGKKGTGLGLSTVHAAVQNFGGRILVESAPGLGATFRVLIPAAAGD